jgi:hypothetical protein
MNGVDDNGKPINMSIDKNGFVLNGDKVSMNISGDQDTYAEDAKPIEGLKNYNRDGQLMTIVSQKGVIQSFNTKGELTSIFKPNGVVKSYQNKKLTSIVDNGKKSNFNYSYSTNTKTNKKGNDPYNTIRLKAENGFSYVIFDLNDNKIWKCYKDGKLLTDLTLNNNKPYYEGHIATSEELKRLGLLWYNNSFNPLTGGFQIVNKDINGSQGGNHYDEDDIVEERVEALTSRAEDMQQMVSGSKCKNLDVQWFTWANARLIAHRGLISANKSKEGLDNVENEQNAIQKQFDKIKANKKNSDCSECKDCGEEQGFIYSYGTDEQVRRNAKKMAEQARRNAKLSAEQSRRNAEQLRQDMEQSKRDSEQAKRDSEQAKRDSEQARHDATSGVAKDNLFRSLVNEGFIKLNEKCTIRFHNDQLKVNGKNLDEATFNRFKAAFEKKLGKKTNYFIKFSGVVMSVSENGVNMTGTFTNSISNDD